jgi:hypothetical protein
MTHPEQRRIHVIQNSGRLDGHLTMAQSRLCLDLSHVLSFCVEPSHCAASQVLHPFFAF